MRWPRWVGITAVVALLTAAPSALALTPTIENTGSNMFEQTVSSREDGNSANRLEINAVVKHDTGKKVTGLKVDTDYNGTDNSSSAPTQTADVATQPAVVGGFNYTTAFLSFRNTVSNIACGDRPGFTHTIYVRPVLSDGTVGNSSSASIFFTPAGGCNFPIGYEDYSFMYGQTNTSPVQLTPGGTASFSFKADDPDTGNNTQGYAYRFRRLNDGSTTGLTVVCPGDIDNETQTRTYTFPNQRGHWVVEAELRQGDGCTDQISLAGKFWRIGSADVNTAQTASPSLSLSATRPQTNGSTTVTATTDDADDASNGGAPQYIEWDFDNNGTYDDANLGTAPLGGAGDDSDTLTSAEKQTTINTTGKAPGTYTVKARVTDNGAMNASDAIRRQTTATTTYRVNSPPLAEGQALGAESGKPLSITLAGTDPDGDSLSYSIVDFPVGGELTGSGASRTYTAAPDFVGQDSFDFQVADGYGGTATATVSITVRPDTKIDTGPSPSQPNSPDGSVSFSSTVAGVTFECRLDSTDPEAWGACSSPYVYDGLTDGVHTFDVRARTSGGLVDPTPASVTFTVDAEVPDTVIDSGPPARTASTSAELTFSATEDGSTVQCRLDGGDWATCTSSQRYENLSDGQHVFEARATDEVGQTDSTPASHTWRVDTRSPETAVTSGPPSTTASGSASFDFDADEAGATFKCRLDSSRPEDFTPCTSPATYVDRFEEGRHTFDVQATDSVDNVETTPATVSWTVDQTPPDTTLQGGPSGISRSSDASFDIGSTQEGSTLACRLDGGTWRRCSSPATYSGLADGAHTFEVRATDAAGNIDPDPASRAWTVDATPPQTAIESGPRGVTTSSEATFELSSSETGATLECRLDGGQWTACDPQRSYSGLARGSHTFEARAVDRAGNVDPTPAAREWTVEPSRGGTGDPDPVPPTLSARIALPRRGTATNAGLTALSPAAELSSVRFTLPRDTRITFGRRSLGRAAGSMRLTAAGNRPLRSFQLKMPKRARRSALLLKSGTLRVTLKAGRAAAVTITGIPPGVNGVSLALAGRKTGLLTVPKRCFAQPVIAALTYRSGPPATLSRALSPACPAARRRR